MYWETSRITRQWRTLRDKAEDLLDDIKDNETVKNVTEKVEDTFEELKKNETVKNVTEKLGSTIENAGEQVQKSGFWQKIKGFFGGK